MVCDRHRYGYALVYRSVRPFMKIVSSTFFFVSYVNGDAKCEQSQTKVRAKQSETDWLRMCMFSCYLLWVVCMCVSARVFFFLLLFSSLVHFLSAWFHLVGLSQKYAQILLTHHMRPNSHTYRWQCRPHARYWGVQYGTLGMGESVYVCGNEYANRVLSEASNRATLFDIIAIIFYTTGILLMPFLRFLLPLSLSVSRHFL